MVIRKGLQWRSCLFFGFLSQGSGRQPGGLYVHGRQRYAIGGQF